MQPSIRKALVGASLLGAVVAGGAVSTFAATLGSDDSSTVATVDASDDSSSDSTIDTSTDTSDDSSIDTSTDAGESTTASDSPPTPRDPGQGGHNANGITEVLLTGDDADKATEAALAAVPGATIERVETDAEGDAYEAHIVTADGAHQTVKLDEDFIVISVEDGPGGHGCAGPDASAPADTSTTTG